MYRCTHCEIIIVCASCDGVRFLLHMMKYHLLTLIGVFAISPLNCESTSLIITVCYHILLSLRRWGGR